MRIWSDNNPELIQSGKSSNYLSKERHSKPIQKRFSLNEYDTLHKSLIDMC